MNNVEERVVSSFVSTLIEAVERRVIVFHYSGKREHSNAANAHWIEEVWESGGRTFEFRREDGPCGVYYWLLESGIEIKNLTPHEYDLLHMVLCKYALPMLTVPTADLEFGKCMKIVLVIGLLMLVGAIILLFLIPPKGTP